MILEYTALGIWGTCLPRSWVRAGMAPDALDREYTTREVHTYRGGSESIGKKRRMAAGMDCSPMFPPTAPRNRHWGTRALREKSLSGSGSGIIHGRPFNVERLGRYGHRSACTARGQRRTCPLYAPKLRIIVTVRRVEHCPDRC
jgi:hypothetical protein